MQLNRKLSTHTRTIIGFAIIISLTFIIGLPFSSTSAKNAVEQSESSVTDRSVANDTTLPEMIFSQEPEYPRLAKAAGLTGTVWVKALVTKAGDVQQVTVSKSSGVQSLDDAAVKAAWQNRFKPASVAGKSVPVWVTYKVDFELDGIRSWKSDDNREATALLDSPADDDTTLPAPDESLVVDVQPEMIYQQPPVYPREAKMSGQTGTVWIKVLVDTLGTVRGVEIQKGSGHTSLDNATKDAAWKSRFIPAKKDGQPAAVWITYKVDFKLTDG